MPCAAAAARGAGMGLPEKAGMWKGIRWRMKNSFFRKYKNEFALYRIRKKLLTIIAVLLVVFAMLTMLLFYLSERSSYQKNMAESNEIMASQMASVYELYMQNVKEIAHDTAKQSGAVPSFGRGAAGSASQNKDIGHAGFHQCDEPVCPFGISVL